MNTPTTTLATLAPISALPATAFRIGAAFPLFAVPCDGGWTAYTPDGEGFRAFGELVYASSAQLARVMGAY